LDTLPAQANRLAFLWYSASSTNWNCCIDDIRVTVHDANCSGLTDFRAMAASAHEGSIIWSSTIGAQSIDIEVSDSANFSVINAQYPAVTANPFVIGNLAQNHQYYVRGRQTCDVNGDWMTAEFKTLCDAVDPDTYPIQTFEQAGDFDCWVVGVSMPGKRNTNNPSINSSTSLGHYLYFNKSATASDTITYGDGLYAILPELNIDSITRYEVSFNAFKTSTATNNAGKLAVGVITDPADFSTFTSIQTMTLDYAADSTVSKSYTVNFKDYMGDYNDDFGKFIMFLAQSGDSANAIGVDNVELSYAHSCPQILEGRITDIEQNSAVYRWNANGASQYEVVVLTEIGNPAQDEAIFSGMTDADSIVITGLSPASTYYAYVRAHCGEEVARWSVHTRFQSACGSIATLPWSEGFEDYDGGNYNATGDKYSPVCWNTYADQTVVPHVVVAGSYVAIHSGDKALAFYGVGNCYAELPEFDIPLNQLCVSFWTRYESTSNGTMYFGYFMPEDSVFHPILECTPSHTEYRQYEVNLDTIPAQASRLAFLYYSASTTNWNGCIDDVTVSRIPSCQPLGSIVIDEIGRRDVTVKLMPKPGVAPVNSELVCSERRLSIAALDSAAKMSVDTTGIYTITGLNRGTQYYIYARNNCGEADGASDWINTVVTTKNVGPDCRYSEPGTLINSTSKIQYVPWSDWYKSTRSEQIYLKEELLAQGLQAGYISKIAFQYAHNVAFTKTVTLFLGTTEYTSFPSTSFVDLTEVSDPVETEFVTDG
jgi:hypothetical protein